MKHTLKKLLGAALALVMCVSIVTPAMAAPAAGLDVADRAVAFYEGADSEFVKISHPEKPTSTETENVTDGLVDYLGNSRVGVPGVDEGANGQGDRGHSYSWAATNYGDWMYVATQYNPMMSTIGLMGAGLGNQFDPEVMEAFINACYRGEFFIEEEDGGNPKSILCKLNVKTGELHILMSMEKTGTNVNFRNAVTFNDKVYFCGGVNGVPSIYEIDPNNGDKITCVFQDESMKKPGAWPEALKKQLSPAIRGMCAYGEYLVINCVGLDENPYVAISKNPAEGFTKIAFAWDDVENQVPGELLGYPACHLPDSIYGGSIFDIAVFNNALYVAMCTGTPDNSPDGGKTMQSFAIVRGECTGDPESREDWEWTPVIGDKERDGARYTFGIDPERTRAGACTLMVYNDHLYIGEYNDTEIALINFLFDQDLEFMADNLEQSVSLYRMDADENIELVMGDPTEMFPKSLSGMGSGFDQRENQYIWRMDTFQGKLYIGTFDETCLMYPLGQFSNGDILHLTPEQWERQVKYLKELLDLLKEKEDKPEQQVAVEMAAAFDEVEPTVSVLSLPATMGEEGGMKIDSLAQLQEAVILLGGMLENDDEWTEEELLQAKELFAKFYQLVYDFYTSDGVQKELPESIQKILDELLNEELMGKMKSLLRCLKITRTAERGFDMVVTEDGVNFDVITRDGMGDCHNHGLRVFAVNDDPTNPWMTIGTANPFYGTQIWRLQNDDLVIPGEGGEGETPDPDPEKPDPEPDPEPETPDPEEKPETPDPEEKPDPEDKPAVKPDEKPEVEPETEEPEVEDEEKEPETGDSFALGLMVTLCLASGAAIVVMKAHKKRA